MATNPVPMSNITFEVFEDGERLLGIASVTLSELSLKSAEVAGAGILGSMDWPIYGQFENAELTLNFRVVYDTLTKFLSPNAHMLDLRGVYEKYDAATGTRNVHGLKIVARGLTKTCNLGKLEPGETSDAEVTLHLDYLKITDSIDGELFELDKFNYKYNVLNQDFFNDVITALGL